MKEIEYMERLCNKLMEIDSLFDTDDVNNVYNSNEYILKQQELFYIANEALNNNDVRIFGKVEDIFKIARYECSVDNEAFYGKLAAELSQYIECREEVNLDDLYAKAKKTHQIAKKHGFMCGVDEWYECLQEIESL